MLYPNPRGSTTYGQDFGNLIQYHYPGDDYKDLMAGADEPVSQRDISSWADWWFTADFTLFQANWFKAPPFEDPEDYKTRSALTYVDNIHTPILFVLGEEDYRARPGRAASSCSARSST